jgi:hypothetical protein
METTKNPFEKNFEKTFEKNLDILCNSSLRGRTNIPIIISDINNMAIDFIENTDSTDITFNNYIKELIIQSSEMLTSEIKDTNEKNYDIERSIIYKNRYYITIIFLCELINIGWFYNTYRVSLKIKCYT